MTRTAKIQKIQYVLKQGNPCKELYKDMLNTMGDLKSNYNDYMITEPLDCKQELERIPGADYELCTAMLTMVLDNDFLSDRSPDKRVMEHQVVPILERMKTALCRDI